MIDAKGQGHGSPAAPSGFDLSCYSPWGSQLKSGKGAAAIMDIGVMAQILSLLVTFVVAAGILYQGREAPVWDYY